MVKDTHIDKERLCELLAEARELKPLYDEANRKNPHQRYDYGSVDRIALRLFERREGVLVIGITSNNQNVHLHAVRGMMVDRTSAYVEAGTSVTYTLEDFTGTTVARFAESVDALVKERAFDGSCPELKKEVSSTYRRLPKESKVRAYAQR